MTISGFDIHGDFGPNFNFKGRYDQGDRFCVLKATGGHTFFNGNLIAQAKGARAAGLALGYYHYMFEPSVGGGNVNLEADNFIKIVSQVWKPGDTLWLDVEEAPATVGVTNLGDWIVAWCERVAAHFGCQVGVYTGTYYLVENGLTGDNRLTKYPLWLASWQTTVPGPVFLKPWKKATLWQWNADQLDKDIFFGTVEDWKAMGAQVVTKQDTGGDEIRTGVLSDGRPYVQVVFAGNTPRVDGADVQDLSIAVDSATEPGKVLDQSVQGNKFNGWRVR